MTAAGTAMEQRPSTGVRTLVTALAKTASGSLASGLLAAAAAKILAVMLGPAAVALVSTLQQIQKAALVMGTLNGQPALVQGASAFAGPRQRDYVRTVFLLFAIATLATAICLLAFPEWIGHMAGMPPQWNYLIRWLAIPVAVLSGSIFLGSLLRVAGEIGRLAWIQVLAALAMALAAWPAALAFRAGQPHAMVALLAASAMVGGGAAWWASANSADARYLLTLLDRRLRIDVASARHFFSISGAMLASGLLASLVLLVIRARITRSGGLDSTGQFDAAWAISMNHVTLILTAMLVYCLPVVARARDSEERRKQIAAVLKVAILASVPLIVAIALAKPLVISLLFTSAFHPAGRILRWTLVGDYFKVTAWVLGMPMLAGADMRSFLAVDFLTQGTFLAVALWLRSGRDAAETAAIAFLISYAVTFTFCAIYARRSHGFRFGPKLAALWLGGMVAVGLTGFLK